MEENVQQNIDINFSTNAEAVATKTEKVVTATDKVVQKQKEQSKQNKEVEDTSKSLSNTLDNMTGNALSGFKSMVSGIKGMAMSFRTLGGAIAATGLGLLVIVVGSLVAAFSSSEEGQNKFASLMAVIGSVVGNVMDVISDLGEIIIGVLSGDSKAIKSATDFGKKIFDVVGLPIKNIIDIVKTAGKVLGSLFSGDVKGALENLKQGVADVKGNFVEAGNAINDAKNSLVEFGKEALREAEIAKGIAKDRANADKMERGLIVEKAEAERRRADLLEKAQQRDKFTQAERVKFLKEAGKIDEEITNKQIAAAKLRANAIIEENKLSKSNKDALKAEEEAKAEIIRLETARLSRAKEVTGQIVGLQEQEKASAQAAFNEKKRLMDAEKAKRDAFFKSIKDMETNYLKSIEDLRDKTEEQKLERQKSRDLEAIEQMRLQGANVEELLRLNSEKYAILEDELIEKRREEKRIKDQEYWAKEAEDAAKRGEEQRIIDDAILQQKQEIEDQKLNIASRGIQLISQIFGKSKAIQKAAIIAENAVGIGKMVIDNNRANIGALSTPQAIASSGATAAPTIALNNITTGIGIASSIAATAKALSALGGGSAPSGGKAGGMPGGGSAPQVGFQNSNENQISNSINASRAETPPVQAFVVSQEVTNSQQIDRNRILSNSF